MPIEISIMSTYELFSASSTVFFDVLFKWLLVFLLIVAERRGFLRLFILFYEFELVHG